MSKKKKILFLHPNFPAQFKNICLDFSSQGHDVAFLCQTHYGRKIPGVLRLCMKGDISMEKLDEEKLGGAKRCHKTAEQFRKAFISFETKYWKPDIVISHSGWGCGVNVKEIWPSCFFIAYSEWWFEPTSQAYKYDPLNQYLNMNSKIISAQWSRNMYSSLELSTADRIVSPTNWQKNQLPANLRMNCEVIFDGINSEQFKPNLSKRKEVVVTYGTRGMEPLRMFPQFIRQIPGILKRFPSARFEIAGEDRICYGGKKPDSHDTWGKWAQEFLSEMKIGEEKVIWLGYLNPKNYIDWLQRSMCHVYLSHPFVISWSYVEALTSGCPIVASDIYGVREFGEKYQHQVNLIDHRVAENIADGVLNTLEKYEILHQKPEYTNALNEYSISTCIPKWRKLARLL